MTYVEAKGGTVIDYRGELGKDKIDWHLIGRGSMNWLTDPIGHLPVEIKRHPSGVPEDTKLKQLGFMFNKAALNRDKEECLNVLDQIDEYKK